MGKRLDLVGERFGKLVVKEPQGINKRGASLWLCTCDCGNITTVIGGYLTFGVTRSCGCLRDEVATLDLKGKKFGSLTAISKAGIDSKGYVLWVCVCDCGNAVTVVGSNLSRGKKISCGCKTNKLKLGEAAKNQVIRWYKRNAKTRKLPWELTDEELTRSFQLDCHYCGKPPSNVSKPSESNNGEFIYNGIDRVDNLLGYCIDNIVSCCRDCNWAKGNKTSSEFSVYISRLINYQLTKKQTFTHTNESSSVVIE